jgi:hypothetical protein
VAESDHTVRTGIIAAASAASDDDLDAFRAAGAAHDLDARLGTGVG